MNFFEITITCHDQYGIQLWNNDNIDDFQKKKDFLKMAVTNNYIESEYYKIKQLVNPFLQSCDDDFIMIEFWTDDLDIIEKYVEFLNKKYNDDWHFKDII